MPRRPALIVLCVALLTQAMAPSLSSFAASSSRTAAAGARPKRALIVVVDAFKPRYIRRFDMDNVKRLRARGTYFSRSIVGHMAAETVISHSVMTSGLFPKHMGWSNEVYRDVDNVLGEGPGAYFVTSSMSCDQFEALASAGGYPKLSDYIDTPRRDRKFVAIGQKPTATCPAGQPVDGNDIIITFSSRNFDCDGDGVLNWRGPTGENVPTYISEPECGRYYVDSDSAMDYGTATTPPAWMYPLDGNRFVPGHDPDHLGGDVWTADAAVEVMRNEPDWGGMLVSLGDVDKVGHMWGPRFAGPRATTDRQAHLRFAVKTADRQIGKIVTALREQGLADETVVIITTDHAIQHGFRFHGVNQPGRSNFNWYYGQDADETYLDPSPAIRPMIAAGNIDFMYQDGHIAAWLGKRSLRAKRSAASTMALLPDVVSTHVRRGGHYTSSRTGRKMPNSVRAWWRTHKHLVNTMAAPFGPDVVGLLRNRTTYGAAGDHGGHQKPIQRIPIIFAGPGVAAGRRSRAEARLVDLLPTVLDLLRVEPNPTHPLDGRVLPVRR
jgi:Type I phosphodiesterase / nucleotide pyrophosphatase